VTLLPRHWEWLAAQPGGASVALRKLVESALRAGGEGERLRRNREVAYRLLFTVAGDRPGFEEVSRALFAGDEEQLVQRMATWPPELLRLARGILHREE
jgi:hypothetical protein